MCERCCRRFLRTASDHRQGTVPDSSIESLEAAKWDPELRLGLKRLLRSEVAPISVGFPFGFSVIFPPNLPLPTKIVTEIPEPIDITAQFGADPDVAEVDAHVRAAMQSALDRLAHRRRLPVLG